MKLAKYGLRIAGDCGDDCAYKFWVLTQKIQNILCPGADKFFNQIILLEYSNFNSCIPPIYCCFVHEAICILSLNESKLRIIV